MITEKHFVDWEAQVFGFGYGSGESYVLRPLKQFFALCKQGTLSPRYSYEELEERIGCSATWLLINALCHADVIEYGISPRYAWLTGKGILLKEFVDSYTVEELCGMVAVDKGYVYCFSGHCNCEPEGPNCNNPLFPVGG
jgi:hypothetical protein